MACRNMPSLKPPMKATWMIPTPVLNGKVKKDSDYPDRRLKRRERSLQDMKTSTAFEADVAMPIRLQSKMKKTSGDANRRLATVECFDQNNGLLACVQYDLPGEGWATVFLDCPVSATSLIECQSCSIVVTADNTPNEIDLENDPQCLSCSICSDPVAYDCSNLAEGDCVIKDCGGTCTASDGGGGVVYGLQPSCISVDSENFNVCLDLKSVSGSYESWMEAFATAAQRWESIIVGDLSSYASSELYEGPDFTGTGYPSEIDDVYICGEERSIDGEGGVLGSGGPHFWRGSGVVNPRTEREYQVTLTGYMKFDSADVAILQASGTFDEVVFHEMGHVFGLGTLWDENGLYNQGSGEYASGTHADDEWKAIGCSGPLPVELHYDEGTKNVHWDEDCLGNEIMTGYSEDKDTSQPISRVTIGTLEDMGYEVDYSQADPFTIADLGVCGSFCPEARRGLRRNNRKMKAKLGSEDWYVIMRYAKTELTKLHKEFEIAAVVRGGHDDGITAVEELHVLYQNAKGQVHTVQVTWDEVKDFHI